MSRTAVSLSFSDIDGSLASLLARSRSFVNRTTAFVPFCTKRSLSYVLVSCTTISVYVNLSKNELQMERIEDWPPPERRSALICGCKGTAFPGTDKTLRDFFQKKMHFIRLYIIYYIRARRITEGKEGKGGKKRKRGGEGEDGGAMTSHHTGRRDEGEINEAHLYCRPRIKSAPWR